MRDKLRKTPEILFEPKINSLNLKKLPQGVTIKLNNPILFATKSDLDELSASTGSCHALVCKHALYSIEVASIALPPAVANLLQEYMDAFP
jgi:hypothetical protein